MGRKRKKHDAGAKRRKDALQISVGFLVVGVVITAVLGIGLWSLTLPHGTTTGTITSTADCRFAYTYTVEDRTYDGEFRTDRRYRKNGILHRHYCSKVARALYREGERVPLHYDTRHPDESGLDEPGTYVLPLVGGGLVALFFLTVGVLGLRYVRTLPRDRN